jgi:anhydro-N-acetylmuramic acid kinase
MSKRHLIVGIMSGTSLDGCDAVLTWVSEDPPRAEVLGFVHRDFPDGVRSDLLRIATGGGVTAPAISRVNVGLARFYAEAVNQLLSNEGLRRRVAAIACHGQTVWHAPLEGHTLQLGSGPALAQFTGFPVVHDVRAADVAAGGQGAPLAPMGHRYLFAEETSTLVVNIGGVVSVTFLPAGGEESGISGCDVAPGNLLYDPLVAALFPGETIDRDGALSAGGRADPELWGIVLGHPFVTRKAPKTTGREDFPGDLVPRLQALGKVRGLSPADLLASTADAVAAAVGANVEREGWGTQRVILCGGGAYNPTWVGAFRNRFGASVMVSGDLGIDPLAVEGACWAVLGHRRLLKETGNVPKATGASRPVILGALSLP